MARNLLMALGVALCMVLDTASAEAGYFTTITIDDLYADWAGVPVVDSDGGDNFGGPDIGDTQIANDGQYLYIRNTFPNSLQLSTYIGIDIDQIDERRPVLQPVSPEVRGQARRRHQRGVERHFPRPFF